MILFPISHAHGNEKFQSKIYILHVLIHSLTCFIQLDKAQTKLYTVQFSEIMGFTVTCIADLIHSVVFAPFQHQFMRSTKSVTPYSNYYFVTAFSHCRPLVVVPLLTVIQSVLRYHNLAAAAYFRLPSSCFPPRCHT